MAVASAVLSGFVYAPAGAALGFAVAYGILAWWRGGSRMKGRRGLVASVYGIVPGMIGGFWFGFALVRPAKALAGVAVGLTTAVVLFVVGLIAGIRWAAARGVSNFAGERAAWGLFYVAMPLAVAGGIGGFVLAGGGLE